MNNQRNKRKRNGRRRRAPRKNQRVGNQEGNLLVRDNPRFPNDVKQFPIYTRVIRYIAVSAINKQAFKPSDLLKMMLITVNTSATAYEIMQAIRLRRISIYFVASTGDFGSTSSYIDFAWSGGTNAPDNLITDRGTATQPACIKVKPPRGTIADMWFDANSTAYGNTLFSISCPADTIIDIDFEWIQSNANSATVTLSGAASTTGGALLELFVNKLIPDGSMQTYHE